MEEGCEPEEETGKESAAGAGQETFLALRCGSASGAVGATAELSRELISSRDPRVEQGVNVSRG